jgi:hypothetical protein
MSPTRPAVETKYETSAQVAEADPLPDRLTRSDSMVTAAWQGWVVAAIGSVAAIVAVALSANMLGFLGPVLLRFKEMPPWIVALSPLVLAVGAASMAFQGIRDLLHIRRVSEIQAAYPWEPWRWDYPWNERGARDDTGSRALHFFRKAIGPLVVLLPFHWIGFFGPRLFGFAAVAVLTDLFLLVLLVKACYYAVRRFKYGRGSALFGHFPFRRGSMLELHVQVPRALSQHAKPRATLRCVQERYVDTGRSTTLQCFEIYRDTAPAELVGAGAGRCTLRVSFTIPADAPTTDLASSPCRYWEVDVEASTDGVDYAARFMVPVY